MKEIIAKESLEYQVGPRKYPPSKNPPSPPSAKQVRIREHGCPASGRRAACRAGPLGLPQVWPAAGRVGLHPAHRHPQDPGSVPGHSELQERRTRQTGTFHRGDFGQEIEILPSDDTLILSAVVFM